MFRQVYIVALATITISVLVASRRLHEENSLGIVGGKEATPHESPSTVRLQMFKIDDQGREWWTPGPCGGILINESYVISAKHCIEKKDKVKIFLGNHDILNEADGEQMQEVYKANFIQHPTADLVIFELDTKVVETDKIKVARLPLRKDVNETYAGHDATAYGWGQLGDNKPTSPVLMKVDVKIGSDKDCWLPHDYSICTTGNNATHPVGTCQGDSGGPLFINKNLLVGITTGGGYCSVGHPSFYLRPDRFYDWMEQKTEMTFP